MVILLNYYNYYYVQVRRSDGRLVAKAIDVDLSLFRSALLSTMDHDREAGVECSSDTDCTFFNCLGECDMTTGVCSGKLASSNLVVSPYSCIIAGINTGSSIAGSSGG